MSETTRLISFVTLFLAVLLPALVLFLIGSKDLARVVFAAVLIVGYGTVLVRLRQGR